MVHVFRNIVTQEQSAGGKKVWGTVEQLLGNKSILKEVRLMRGNISVWLDYKEAFHSIQLTWLLHALKLKFAKLPNHLTKTKQKLNQIMVYKT